MRTESRTTIATALAVATMALLWSDTGAAQTVRRNLRCELIPAPTSGGGGFLSLDLSARAARITNQWSLTIPRGTTYTVVVNRQRKTYSSKSALGPGQSLLLGSYRGINSSACGASVPG